MITYLNQEYSNFQIGIVNDIQRQPVYHQIDGLSKSMHPQVSPNVKSRPVRTPETLEANYNREYNYQSDSTPVLSSKKEIFRKGLENLGLSGKFPDLDFDDLSEVQQTNNVNHEFVSELSNINYYSAAEAIIPSSRKYTWQDKNWL